MKLRLARFDERWGLETNHRHHVNNEQRDRLNSLKLKVISGRLEFGKYKE